MTQAYPYGCDGYRFNHQAREDGQDADIANEIQVTVELLIVLSLALPPERFRRYCKKTLKRSLTVYLPDGLWRSGPMGLSTEYVFSDATSFMEDLSNQSAVTCSFHIPVEAGQEYMASIWAMVIKGNAFIWNSGRRPMSPIHFVTDRIEASKEWQQLVTKEVPESRQHDHCTLFDQDNVERPTTTTLKSKVEEAQLVGSAKLTGIA